MAERDRSVNKKRKRKCQEVIDRSVNKKRKGKMAKTPERVIVCGVNDTITRRAWIVLGLLCIYGSLNAAKAMEIDLVGYMGALTLYVLQLLRSIFSETPSPICRAYRLVRTFVPCVLYVIIYFTIYNFPTIQVYVMVFSISFGVVVLVQLTCPVDGFHFAYVVAIIIIGCVLANHALYYDHKNQPFWFCFLTLFIFQFLIYGLNTPGKDTGFFSFY